MYHLLKTCLCHLITLSNFPRTDLCIENRAGYFARELHESMAGMGTRDRALIRLVVSRSEIDMGNIKQEYQKLFNKPLEKAIRVREMPYLYFTYMDSLSFC